MLCFSAMSSDTCRIILGGDTMLGRGVNETIKRLGPAYPVSALLPLLQQSDAVFVNLECAITDKAITYQGPPKAFYFRADPVAIETLKWMATRLVNLANNHALDADVVGLKDTLSLLDQHQIAHVGAGMDLTEASTPAILEIQGIRVGILGYCDHQPDFAAGPDKPGIRYVDVSDPVAIEQIKQEINHLSSQVDATIISFHWMPNWVPSVPPFYRRLAHELVEAGATIIWGHSPHHFLGVEWINTAVVLYSTGDLIDDYAIEPTYRNDLQLLFRCTLSREGVTAVEAHPLKLDFARTRPATGPERKWITERFAIYCAEVGSKIVSDHWIRVLPSSSEV